jgi:hypothetical protein
MTVDPDEYKAEEKHVCYCVEYFSGPNKSGMCIRQYYSSKKEAMEYRKNFPRNKSRVFKMREE